MKLTEFEDKITHAQNLIMEDALEGTCILLGIAFGQQDYSRYFDSESNLIKDYGKYMAPFDSELHPRANYMYWGKLYRYGESGLYLEDEDKANQMFRFMLLENFKHLAIESELYKRY